MVTRRGTGGAGGGLSVAVEFPARPSLDQRCWRLLAGPAVGLLGHREPGPNLAPRPSQGEGDAGPGPRETCVTSPTHESNAGHSRAFLGAAVPHAQNEVMRSGGPDLLRGMGVSEEVGAYARRPDKDTTARNRTLARNPRRPVVIYHSCTSRPVRHESLLARLSPVPHLAALPLHSDAGRIADLDPHRARP